MSKANYLYNFLVLRNKVLAQLFPFKKPPILILSYPRSGSTWVGNVLSKSPSVAFLKEPINKSYLKYYGKYTLTDLKDLNTLSIYKKITDETFKGIIPRFKLNHKISKKFSPLNRSKYRLMIKEVNPNAASLYVDKINPNILFLIRHPADVALSFSKLDWFQYPDNQMDTGNKDANCWEKFGYAYGTVLSNAIRIIKEKTNPKIVFFENLAINPEDGFSELFDYFSVKKPKNYEKIMNEYCFNQDTSINNANPYNTKRTSIDQLYKWRKDLSSSEIESVKKGYFLSNLSYYRDKTDW